MRIEETNQILRESDLERLNRRRLEEEMSGGWWKSPTLGTSVAVTAVALAVGLLVWRSRR